jgi:hypothetical protein
MKFRRSALFLVALTLVLDVFVVPVFAMGLMPVEPPFLEVVRTVFYGTGLNIILGLIALDLVLGVSAAIKTNTFDWYKLGQFYWTMVLPYVLSYAVLYAVDLFVPDLLGAFLDAALVVAAFGAITTNLLSSIGGHLVTLGLRRA